jgi:tetratricopeptide (TPR) repeat protein
MKIVWLAPVFAQLFTPLFAPLFAQCPAKTAAFGDSMAAGARAYQAAKYPEAAACFAQAAKADATSLPARLNQGFALLQQYVPGDHTPPNQDIALAARQRFVDVLDLDPKNADAMASIGRLAYQQQNFDDARLWYGKLADAEPKSAEAYYMLGVIGWAETNVQITQARDGLGMQPGDRGPLKDPAVREETRKQNWDRIAKAIEDLNRALRTDPAYDDAMAYLNLLYRERADLQGEVAYRADIATADLWKDKAVALKQKKISQTMAK